MRFRVAAVLILLAVACYAEVPAEWEDDNTTSVMVVDEEEEMGEALGQQIFSLFWDAFGGANHSTADDTWTIVSFITLAPLRCSDVQEVLSWFDEALQQANPGARVSSVAHRLGDALCDAAECPCEARRSFSQVMEVRTRSTRQVLAPPPRFPYRVRMEG